MGEHFEHERHFTVEALLGYNLSTHDALITTVHKSAHAEYIIEQKLNNLKRLWEERTFKLAKHMCDSVYRGDSNGE